MLIIEYCVPRTPELFSEDSYFSAVAAKCPLTLDNGDLVSCVPTITGFDVTYTNPVTLVANTYSFVPPQVTCSDVITDVVSVAWQVVVWIIAEVLEHFIGSYNMPLEIQYYAVFFRIRWFMDTYKIVAIIAYCFFPSVAFSFVCNSSEPGSGALRSSPLGLSAHSSSGNVSLESGRNRSTPNFTFGTADCKQVGFKASRLSNIATGRVGAARFTGQIGIGVIAALLICYLSDICDQGDGEFVKVASENDFPPTTQGSYND